MTNTMLLYSAFWLLPTLVMAQMDEFQQEFMKSNQRYLSERNIKVTQHYLFSLDSAAAIPFDSSYCYIEKNDRIIHYKFNGAESFSDGTYLIRISNPGKYMVVSRNSHADSSALKIFFSEGFSGFKNVEKKNIIGELSQWKLTGGTYGVLAVDITINTQEARIRNILAELSADHPFVSQINPRKSGKPHNVFIRIDYTYTTELSKEQPQFSDFIHVENDVVTPVEKFKDYQIKFIK
jgi:hypothetical protein